MGFIIFALMNRPESAQRTEVTLDMVYQPIRSKLLRVEKDIEEILTKKFPVTDEIYTYIFKKPGKMLRPALALLAANTLVDTTGNDTIPSEKLIKLGVVLELLHNASLLHDDVLDRSAKRRGRASLNADYNDKIAVLAGDVLFSNAFAILARSFEQEITIPITEITSGMCNGEILAANSEGSRIDIEDYYRIIRLKTAEFTGICCYAGALCANGNKEAELLYEYGVHFGLAYQIRDDYTDGDAEHVDGFSPALIDRHIPRARQVLRKLDSTCNATPLLDLLTTVFASKPVPA